MMLVSVYQIKDWENSKYMFASWRLAEKYFNLKDYEEVYSYFVDMRPNKDNGYSVLLTERDVEKILDNTYHMLNVNRPEDFKGHSLSVSDIIAVGNSYYYCDMFGWKKINN